MQELHHGLNLGDNSFAALLTRGLVEVKRLGEAVGGKESTFYGLTGLRRFNCNLYE